jgi:hypothetical protein
MTASRIDWHASEVKSDVERGRPHDRDPVLGCGHGPCLLARPELDLEWRHDPSHFWLVLLSATVNAVLAYLTKVAAGRYLDARSC